MPTTNPNQLQGVGRWRSRCVELAVGENEFEVFCNFVTLASELGYSKVAYGLEFPNSIARPDFCYFDNFYGDWRTRFGSAGSALLSAKSATGKRTSGDGDKASPHWRKDDFVLEAQAHGVEFSSLQAVPGVAGTTSFIGLARGPQYPSSQLRQNIVILVDHIAVAMTTHLVPKHLPQYDLEITELESDCLQWVLDGKTAYEIAGILQMPIARVRNMQRNLAARFDKPRILATAVLAFRMGLLTGGRGCMDADILGTSIIKFGSDERRLTYEPSTENRS